MTAKRINNKQIKWSFIEHQKWWGNEYHPPHDIELIFTKNGISVTGYYDNIVGMGNEILIPWTEIEQHKKDLGI